MRSIGLRALSASEMHKYEKADFPRAGDLTVALMARTAYIVHAQTATAAELRMQLSSRYDIVALQQGIALVPKTANPRVRMIQVSTAPLPWTAIR